MASTGGGAGKDATGVQAWTLCDLPTVRNQLNIAKSCLQPLLTQLGEAGDSRGYHGLGPLTPAHESVVTSNLSLIQEALEQFTKWSKDEPGDTSQRYLAHCKEVSDRVSRLQDNRRALAECRRLLERHTSASSRRKFLEQTELMHGMKLEAIARESGVTFYSMEEGGEAISDTSQPSHCLSGQTFVLDLHVDAAGKVAWGKLQRIKLDGSSVPDEGEAGEEQWEALNASIVAGLHSTDMEANLKSKFRALHLMEEAHGKHPEVGVYDALRELEVAVEQLHADKGAMGDGEQAWSRGMGTIERLVEGLLMEYYQSVAPTCAALPLSLPRPCAPSGETQCSGGGGGGGGVEEMALAGRRGRLHTHCGSKGARRGGDWTGLAGGVENAKALLQMDGVSVGTGPDAKPKAVMGLKLQPSVMACMATAGALQTLGQKVRELPVPLFRVTNGVSWHALVRPESAEPKEGCLVEAKGQRFWFVDHSSDAMGVEVHNVPVGTAAEVLQALQLLRQQHVMTEVYTSCLANDEDEEEGEADVARTNGAHVNGINGTAGEGDHMDTEADPPRLVEVTASPPSTILLHTALSQASSLELLCIEIDVLLGGDIAVRMHVPEGVEPPCTAEYATTVLNTCKTLPLALAYMFQAQA